jgi:hypothetical protein
MTITTLTPAPQPAGRPQPVPVTVCHICLKRSTAQHTPATRMVHADHLTRMGWSGMCPAPRPLDDLRATLIAQGCTATSPARLDAEGERMAREDRQS